jgi:hypothetical protein
MISISYLFEATRLAKEMQKYVKSKDSGKLKDAAYAVLGPKQHNLLKSRDGLNIAAQHLTNQGIPQFRTKNKSTFTLSDFARSVEKNRRELRDKNTEAPSMLQRSNAALLPSFSDFGHKKVSELTPDERKDRKDTVRHNSLMRKQMKDVLSTGPRKSSGIGDLSPDELFHFERGTTKRVLKDELSKDAPIRKTDMSGLSGMYVNPVGSRRASLQYAQMAAERNVDDPGIFTGSIPAKYVYGQGPLSHLTAGQIIPSHFLKHIQGGKFEEEPSEKTRIDAYRYAKSEKKMAGMTALERLKFDLRSDERKGRLKKGVEL